MNMRKKEKLQKGTYRGREGKVKIWEGWTEDGGMMRKGAENEGGKR